MHLIPNASFRSAKPRARISVRALRLPRFLAWQVPPMPEREAERPTGVPGGKALAGKRQRQIPAMSNNPDGTHACNTELTSN